MASLVISSSSSISLFTIKQASASTNCLTISLKFSIWGPTIIALPAAAGSSIFCPPFAYMLFPTKTTDPKLYIFFNSPIVSKTIISFSLLPCVLNPFIRFLVEKGNPDFFTTFITAPNLSGCLGAISSFAPGQCGLNLVNIPRRSSSSLLCVLPPIITVFVLSIPISEAIFISSAVSGSSLIALSNFRLPAYETFSRGAPIRSIFSASGSVCIRRAETYLKTILSTALIFI